MLPMHAPLAFDPELLRRYDRPGPRYTSYPTAPRFHDGFGEAELRAAARVRGVREVAFLDYLDGEADAADPAEAVARIVAHLRRVRPHVVVTFDPFGLYGHPDHVAICQLTTAAVVAAAASHRVDKLYYMTLGPQAWAAYQEAFKLLVSRVDGVERQATPWPDWSISARIDTRDEWERVWRAVRCHQTQLAGYARLGELTPEHHQALWGSQTFYRALSLVNGGRQLETDLFAGVGDARVVGPRRDPEVAVEYGP